jgi:hypothetical protein
MLLVPPPVRFELTSPYPQYTAAQLDMRRKAEILKYSGNASNSKTNNLTKSEKFAQLVKGAQQARSYTNQILQEIDAGVIDCPNDQALPTPSSSCDVPGPLVYLYDDETIPLYNYINGPPTYAIINPEDDRRWITFIDTSFIYSNTPTNFFTLYIDNNISKNYYTYQFSTSVGLYLTGTSSQVTTAHVSAVYVYVYYNSTLITTNDPTISTIPVIKNQPTSSFSNLKSFQVSPMGSYSATMYAGNLSVSNLLLFTQPGFIYDIRLKVVVSLSGDTAATTGVYLNYGGMGLSLAGCTSSSTASSEVNTGFIFEDV